MATTEMKKRIYLVLETEADEDDKSILSDIEQELGMATHYFETVLIAISGLKACGEAHSSNRLRKKMQTKTAM